MNSVEAFDLFALFGRRMDGIIKVSVLMLQMWGGVSKVFFAGWVARIHAESLMVASRIIQDFPGRQARSRGEGPKHKTKAVP